MRRLTRACARGVVRIAVLWAPAASRNRMTQEWDAELERELARAGGWSVLASACGAFADAGTMRDLERNSEGTMTMQARLSRWIGDFSLATRALARVPGFTAVAVLTLAIGLGGSAAIYTLLDRVVLDPLPYPDADRLVRLENQVPGVGPDEVWALSTAQFVFFADNAQTLSDVGLYRSGGGNIVTPAGPERARSVTVTHSMMALLGAEAHLGRILTAADDEPGAAPVLLVSYGFWERALASDPDVVGTTLAYNDVPVEVVGVLEPGVDLPGWTAGMAPDLWMTMRVNRSGTFGNNHVFPAIAKLAEGATPEATEEELERLTTRLPEHFPDAYAQAFFDRYGFRTVVTPLKESVIGDMARNLWLIFGGVTLVLLIACANVTNLFLVRVEGKRREIGIRIALGADRGAIGRTLVSEALTLAFAGAAVALVVGYWGVPALAAVAPEELPRISGVSMNAGTALFTVLSAFAVGLAIAALPMLSRATPTDVLSSGGRTNTVGRERQRLRSTLVVTQMALAVTLMVGAGLIVESVRALASTDTGMDPEGVITADVYMNPRRYATDVDLWIAYRDMLDGVRALPGVVSAGFGEEVPVAGGYGCTVQGFEDETVYARIRDAGLTTCAGQERVTPGYFEALGIPVLEGRALDEGDLADPARASVVVSRAFADRFWPGESALGRGVAPNGRTVPPYFHVVGVVDDVAKRSSEGQPPLSEDAMAIYYPVLDTPELDGNWGGWWAGSMTLVVRTATADPMSLFPDIRRVIAGVDPEIPMVNAGAMQDVVDQAMVQISFISLLLGIAATVALVLAAIGLYGVITYVVAKRTREIGMRLAIGAEPAAVVRGVVGRTLALVAAGVAVGIPLALGTSRITQSILVGVEPTDPRAYLLAIALLTTVALVASWLPARRAARVDPVTALRSE